ncbi:MAG: primosomal protein N' [Candidatus Choladocola sp.]|nr:primosomal protein N' [Candidatus Choladocola sp.]
MEFVNVIVDISHEKLDRIFQYRIPEELQGKISTGMQVQVPFGMGNRTIKGYVTGVTDVPDYPVEKIKPVTGLVDGAVSAESELIALAAWMKEFYGSTMNQALKTVLPVKQEVSSRQEKCIVLAIPREEAEQLLKEVLHKNFRAKARLLAGLLDHEGKLSSKEAADLKITSSVIQGLERDGVVRQISRVQYRNPFAGKFEQTGIQRTLTEEQKNAVDGIWDEYAQGIRKTYLLEGVTGSGKTEVYMELISRVIAEGKQAIVLIPEIALTFQTVRRFYERFGDRVSVMHSRLSEGERYDQFLRAKSGEIDVMIGPRSALFTPFSQIGVMIIDEEHEGAYKSETVPRYDAREVAAVRAKKHGASLILGSATPSVETSRRAREGKFGWYRLTSRIGQAILPEVSVVDLREELRDGNRSIFSRRLLSAMDDRLKKRQQTMLFLNRRGLSGFVSCRSCGKSIRCPHCDVTLSLHKDGSLRCHYCGYRIPMPKNCPSCGSPYISGFRAGTQQIEREVHRLFPQARVLRMDYDTTRTRESYEQILSAFGNGQADILVGTQMIVKGHDFPDVTLVGIVAADISLYASDYRAAERTFQLLTQAVGRAGRGSKAGEAVIQTYMPEHYSIQTAAKQDYDAFYEQEILYRELMGYPPVDEMLGIYLSGKDLEKLESCAEQLAEWIRNAHVEGLCLIGPADAALARKNDSYRKVIYMKHEKKIILLKIKKLLEQQIAGTDNWNDIFIQFDYNPLQAY